MNNFWTRPSLSRDFTVLAGATGFFLIMIGVWVGFNAYSKDIARDVFIAQILQLVVITLFLSAYLWNVRARIIKPIEKITEAARDITQGKPLSVDKTAHSDDEIQALLTQVRLLSEYMQETRRIENELRNKIQMLSRAKESTEIAMRSKSEFLAYVCQEIRGVLNHVIGFSQTMRDQLHGPLENRKYRQYASDIYDISNNLLGYTQDLLTFSKTETGYITLSERPINVGEMVNKTLRFMADKMQSEQTNLKVQLQNPLPHLIVDEFRLQQILSNLLLYAFACTSKDKSSLILSIKTISETREKQFFALCISNEHQQVSDAQLLAWITKPLDIQTRAKLIEQKETQQDQAELSLRIVNSLVELHQGTVAIEETEAGNIVSIFFPSSRIHTQEVAA